MRIHAWDLCAGSQHDKKTAKASAYSQFYETDVPSRLLQTKPYGFPLLINI